MVFIFFRDTNLTDVMFRLDDQYRWSLDMVAGDTEDELNDVVQSALDGPFYAVHQAVERIYHVDAARRTIEPIVSRAPARWIAGSAGQARLLEHANQRFGLDHLRVMEAADMAADAGTDFAASVKHSVLRLMLRDAQRGGFKLIIDYCGARGMESRPEHRRKFLWMSIVTNFGMLGFFKYFNFFVDNVAAALAAMGLPSDQPTLRILLPVGISFYTFQAMSYTIDVYRGVPITACCSCSPARAGS